MPTAPPKPCRRLGCPELTHDGFCDAHKQHRWDNDRYRGTSASRGYDSEWKRVRVLALKRDKYLCQHCLAAGFVTPAKDVDHIVPLNIAPERRLDLSNLQSLCRPCHRAKTELDKAIPRQDAAQSPTNAARGVGDEIR